MDISHTLHRLYVYLFDLFANLVLIVEVLPTYFVLSSVLSCVQLKVSEQPIIIIVSNRSLFLRKIIFIYVYFA